MSEKTDKIDRSRPVLLGHKYAGCHLGYSQGPGERPGTWRIYSRQIFRWSNRIGRAALAHIGPPEDARVGPWEMIDVPLCTESIWRGATPEAMEALDRVPVSLTEGP